MSAALSPLLPLGAGLAKVLDDRALLVLTRLDPDAAPADLSEQEARVHAARKALKEVRGLVRLLRAAVPAPLRRAADRRARDLGRELSGARDATVLRRTAMSLDLDVEALGLDAQATAPWLPERLGALHDQAFALRESLRDLAPTRGDLAVVEQGLHHTWKAGRNGLRAVRKRPDPHDLHEWRKHVKARMYQERLLAVAWPELLGPVVEELDLLQELLGDHHDLHMLAERLQPEGALAMRITDRQAALEARALRLGARLYAGTASGWVALVGDSVRAWQAEGRSAPRAPGGPSSSRQGPR